MTKRCPRISFRNMDTLLTSVLLPVLMMVLFTYVFGGAMQVGMDSYVNYIVPGIIIQCIGQGLSNTSICVSSDQPLDATTFIITISWCIILFVIFYILSIRLFQHRTTK